MGKGASSHGAGGQDVCKKIDPPYGKDLLPYWGAGSTYRKIPEWCPFKVGDKIEFVFVEK
jgi:hypothetical protein